MQVKTEYGIVEGVLDNGCTVFYGIPFAKPPAGELAFRHPEPAACWEGVRKTDQPAANPIQPKTGHGMKYTSQDCLYLNVFVPENVPEKAPVMVWIYGGSYYEGGAGAMAAGSRDLLYDMRRFAKETGCIVVSFNYRLNVYGFMNFHFLDQRFDQNNGLYDQLQALRFVQNNISSFGGDPENVTVFGQSAGGACILALMGMEESRGLFQKSIVQSPCTEHFFTEEESRKMTRKYLRLAGAERPEDLIHLSEERITSAAEKFSSWVMLKGDIRCAFSPIIDGTTLKEEPKHALKNTKIPMLIGSTAEEGKLFVDPVPQIGLPLIPLYCHVPLIAEEGSYRKRVTDSLTTHIYTRPVKEIVENYRGPIWRYLYEYCIPESKHGCCHISELPVLFGINHIMGRVDDAESERVGKQMRRIWGDFARNGDPGWKEHSLREIK